MARVLKLVCSIVLLCLASYAWGLLDKQRDTIPGLDLAGYALIIIGFMIVSVGIIGDDAQTRRPQQ